MHFLAELGIGGFTMLLLVWHDGDWAASVLDNNCNLMHEMKRLIVVMPVYRRACRFSCFLHFLILLNFHFQNQHAFSVLRLVSTSGSLASQAVTHNFKRITPGNKYSKNVCLTIHIAKVLICLCIVTWLYILLACSGDVHPNPGPTLSASNDSLKLTR